MFNRDKITTYGDAGFVDSDYGGDLDRRNFDYICTLCVGEKRHFSLLQLFQLQKLSMLMLLKA